MRHNHDYFQFNNANSAILHLRVDGKSRDIALDILDVGAASSDETIRDAVARFLDIPIDRLRNLVVERHDNGNITLRPQAVFG